MMKKVKKVTAFAMVIALMLGGKGIRTKAASQSGVLELPAPRASASGTYGSVNWTASLSFSEGTAVATTSAVVPARAGATVTAYFKSMSNLADTHSSGSDYGSYYAKATVSLPKYQVYKATSTHRIESFQVAALSEE